MNRLAHELEEVAFRAWSAEEVVDLDGWRLRFTHGVTHRANSVLPNTWRGTVPLDELMARVEASYEQRGLPPSFQVGAVALPPDLDARLEVRGYVIDAPAVLETVPIEGFRVPWTLPSDVETVVTPSYGHDWFYVSVERGRFSGMKEVYRGILDRMGERAGFAVARAGGAPLGIGLGVVDGEWLGIFNMATLPEARRRGIASAVLQALVDWGCPRGARRAYLQVDRDNTAARALYEIAGFREVYSYHYRTRALDR